MHLVPILLMAFASMPAQADDNLRVVGGQRAQAGVWPDTAAVVFSGNSVGCTGVLVAPNVVLTAGHCIGGITDVILDSIDYTSNQGERIRVQREIEYDPAPPYTAEV